MPLSVNTLSNASVVKEATQTLHAEVENLLLPKLNAIESPVGYAAILTMFYGYFSPMEALIRQHITPEQLPDIPERRKAGAILQDLSAIGHSCRGIPVCLHLPEIKNTAQAFGALYVLEGSTLGGKLIAKMLLKNKALSLTEKALTFFSGYNERTGSKWKTFLEGFNQQTGAEEIVKSANDTFYHLKCWMQHTLYHD
jgi:heme oxygenase (biliverdin-IX-beta and delta-forming)